MAESKPTKTCLHCGQLFPKRKPTDLRRFCSKRCGYEQRTHREARSCLHCRAKFSVRPNSPARLCSRQCAFANRRTPALDRFFSRITPQTNGCWLWRGSLYGRNSKNRGYGVFSTGGRHSAMYAHRWSYLYFIGEIPEGLEIDHLCRTPNCVNPLHLEPVTPEVNSARTRKAVCVNGHPFTPENTLIKRNGARQCRACQAIYRERRRARQARLPDHAP